MFFFEPSAFVYNAQEDLFICPAGDLLKPRKLIKQRNHFEYSLPAKFCNHCALKPQCTRSKQGRTLKRHVRQDDLDKMRSESQSPESKRNIRKRQHLMERSFARSKRYGYKRARLRRLWRVKIQQYLTATIQNILVLVRYVKEQDSAVNVQRVRRPNRPLFIGSLFKIDQRARQVWSFLPMAPC